MNDALDRDDGGYKRLPFRSGDSARGIEHGDGAGFVTIPLFPVDGLSGGKRFGRAANSFDLLKQGWLIVLELDDQVGVRDFSGFECFFGNAWRRR
jgi:hypothetical protein